MEGGEEAERKEKQLSQRYMYFFFFIPSLCVGSMGGPQRLIVSYTPLPKYSEKSAFVFASPGYIEISIVFITFSREMLAL